VSATVHPPPPQQGEPDSCITRATADDVAQVRAENKRLRELVVQLSRVVMQNVTARR
jgi:hypothetical protein